MRKIRVSDEDAGELDEGGRPQIVDNEDEDEEEIEVNSKLKTIVNFNNRVFITAITSRISTRYN